MIAMEKVRYRVTVTCANSDVGRRFLVWMDQEHAEDMSNVEGNLECRVFQLSATQFSAEYIFASQSLLDQYLKVGAEAMRSKRFAHFKDSELSFTRSTSPLVIERKSSHRNPT